MTRLASLAALAILAVAGCGEDGSTATTANSGTLVTYERTGGFASMPESLTVEADGSATVEAGVDPARERFQLDQDELDRLRAELDAAGLESFEEPDGPSGCADCYAFEVTYGGHTVSFDESQQVPAEVTTALSHLSGIIDAHYPPGATDPPIVN